MKNLTEEQIIAAFNKVESETPGWRQQSLHVYKVLISEFCRINGLTAEAAEQREQGQAVVDWRLAIRDLIVAHSMAASCQAGLAPRCICVKCATERAEHILSSTPPTPPSGVPDGFVMVPMDPTPEMIAALFFDGDISLTIGHAAIYEQCVEDYAAMLSAAPQPAAQTQEREAGE